MVEGKVWAGSLNRSYLIENCAMYTFSRAAARGNDATAFDRFRGSISITRDNCWTALTPICNRRLRFTALGSDSTPWVAIHHVRWGFATSSNDSLPREAIHSPSWRFAMLGGDSRWLAMHDFVYSHVRLGLAGGSFWPKSFTNLLTRPAARRSKDRNFKFGQAARLICSPKKCGEVLTCSVVIKLLSVHQIHLQPWALSFPTDAADTVSSKPSHTVVLSPHYCMGIFLFNGKVVFFYCGYIKVKQMSMQTQRSYHY